MHGKAQSHKPSNTTYRRAILKAIEDLHDCHLRSNVDSIRRHVYSSLETDHTWNEVVFMKTLKSIVSDGEVEQITVLNCALSPEYKRRRANSLTAYIENKRGGDTEIPFIPEVPQQQQQALPPQPQALVVNPQLQTLPQQQHSGCELPPSPKKTPKRKAEHDKYKINVMGRPAVVFNQTLVLNRMDTSIEL